MLPVSPPEERPGRQAMSLDALMVPTGSESEAAEVRHDAATLAMTLPHWP